MAQYVFGLWMALFRYDTHYCTTAGKKWGHTDAMGVNSSFELSILSCISISYMFPMQFLAPAGPLWGRHSFALSLGGSSATS